MYDECSKASLIAILLQISDWKADKFTLAFNQNKDLYYLVRFKYDCHLRVTTGNKR